MQTNLDEKTLKSPHAERVGAILRTCVHCGFCNATCPTYQTLGDELDGPRGRIYQMKQYFEGEPANRDMLKHLDRCLLCRSCETTCPSGVKYSELLEIGRHQIESELPRPLMDRLFRWTVVRFINSGLLFSSGLAMSRMIRPILPASLAQRIPATAKRLPNRAGKHTRKVILINGCVQNDLAPNTNQALINILDKLSIEVINTRSGMCCGAAATHTSEPHYGKRQAQLLIDAIWSKLDESVEAVMIAATGCGVSVKDYGALFADDSRYAAKAQRITELYCDPLELLEKELENQSLTPTSQPKRVAFHTPCSMQHGLGIRNRVEAVLRGLGHQVCRVDESHLCCGSAGTYSILQPAMASKLRVRKQKALSVDQPEVIATANIGCQVHIAQGLDVPIVHWLELAAEQL